MESPDYYVLRHQKLAGLDVAERNIKPTD